MIRSFVSFALRAGILSSSCLGVVAVQAQTSPPAPLPPPSHEHPEILPIGGGLKAGEKAPELEGHDLFGKFFSLGKALKRGPVVVVFYRGAWNKDSVDQLNQIQAQLVPLEKERVFAIVAISTEIPMEGLKIRQQGVTFPILIDTKASILGSYKAQHKIPEDEFKRMREQDVDLELVSAQNHHLVAIPSVYVIGRDGKIAYAFVNEHDHERASAGEIVRLLKREAPSTVEPKK